MNEIVFRYDTGPTKSKTEIILKYIWAKVYSYAFLYYRGIYSLDTSLFNPPVAAERVATGVFNIKSLFEQASGPDKILNKQKRTMAEKPLNITNHFSANSIFALKIRATDLVLHKDYFFEFYKRFSLWDKKDYLYKNNTRERKKLNFYSKNDIFGKYDKRLHKVNEYDLFGRTINDIKYGNYYKSAQAKLFRLLRRNAKHEIHARKINIVNLPTNEADYFTHKKPKNVLKHKDFVFHKKAHQTLLHTPFTAYKIPYRTRITPYTFFDVYSLRMIHTGNILSSYKPGIKSIHVNAYDNPYFTTGLHRKIYTLSRQVSDMFAWKPMYLRYHQNLFADKKYKSTERYQEFLFKKISKNVRYSNNKVPFQPRIKSQNIVNLFKHPLAKKYELTTNVYKSLPALPGHYPIKTNIDRTIFVSKNPNVTNVERIRFWKKVKDIIYVNVFKTYALAMPDNILNKEKLYNVKKRYYDLNVNRIFGATKKKHEFSINHFYALNKAKYNISINTWSAAKKNAHIFSFNKWIASQKAKKKAFIIKQSFIYKSQKTTYVFKENFFHKSQFYTHVFKDSANAKANKSKIVSKSNTFTSSRYIEKHASLEKNFYGLLRDDRYATLEKNFHGVFREYRYADKYNNIISIYKKPKNGYLINSGYFNKLIKKDLRISNFMLSIIKDEHDMQIQDLSVHAKNYGKDLSNIWFTDKRWFFGVTKYAHNMRIKDNAFFFTKYPHEMRVKDTIVSVVKEQKYANMFFRNPIWASKKQKHFLMQRNNHWSIKLPQPVHMTQNPVFFQKRLKESWYADSLKRGIKGIKEVYIERNDEWFTKFKREAGYYNKIFWYIKGIKKVWTEKIYRAIKGLIPLNYQWTLTKEFGGFAFPIAKNKRYAYIDRVNEWVKKLARESRYIDCGLWFTMLPKEVFIDYYDVWVAKGEIQAWYEDYISWFSKLALRARFHNKPIWFKMNPKKTYIDGGIQWFKTLPKNVMIDRDNEWAKIMPKKVMTTEEIWAKKYPQDITLFLGVSCFKFMQFGWYDYEIWGRKLPHTVNDNPILFGEKEETKVNYYDLIPDIVRKELITYYDYYLISGAEFEKIGVKFKEESLPPLHHNSLQMMPETDVWAWVYEDPDPFEGDYFGIDELLLPEQEVPYKAFEDLIFDKKRLKPINPVKQLSEQKFLARFPIKSPIKDGREDKGIVYPIGPYEKMSHGSSGIEHQGRWVYPDQGVKTWLLHDVFLAYYRLWQKNLYKFATLDCIRSVNLMLEYLWEWIHMEYGNPEDLQEAIRVYRQVRWYSEAAIINNSQYIVTYNLAPDRILQVDYKNPLKPVATVSIANSVTKDGNDGPPDGSELNSEFILDAADGKQVFKSNPSFYGKDISLDFWITNTKKTEFTFMMTCYQGRVDVWVDNRIIKSYESPFSGQVVSVWVNPIDDEHPYRKISIKKTETENISGMLYVGNIIVQLGKVERLDIEYDPTLHNGNQPLDEIAKKMIAFANLHGTDFYDTMRKNNIGISEAYAKMKQYWELHWENKQKGKRLTIKQT